MNLGIRWGLWWVVIARNSQLTIVVMYLRELKVVYSSRMRACLRSLPVARADSNLFDLRGQAQVTAEFRRPRPSNRRTSAATGPDEEKVVAAGTLNIAGIQEALRLFQGIRAKGEKVQEKPMDVKSLAEKFNVNVVLLERVLKYTSLPEPSRKQKFRN